MSSEQPSVPKLVEQKPVAPTRGPTPATPEKPSATLLAEQDRIKALIQQAQAMTPQQYIDLKKTEPTFSAPTLEVRINRLTKRLNQLEHMSNQQWENERKIVMNDPSKQLAPSPKTLKLPPLKPTAAAPAPAPAPAAKPAPAPAPAAAAPAAITPPATQSAGAKIPPTETGSASH